MVRGSITITLSLVVTVLMSLFLTILNGIQMHAVNIRTNLIAQMGMDSIFAEYNKELLEQYNLFYIDSSYGSENGGVNNTVGHLSSMMEKNISVQDSLWYLPSVDLLGLGIESVVPSSYHIASDYAGYSIREQAISYQKDITGLSIVEYVVDQFNIMKFFDLDSRDLQEEHRELEAQASTSLPDAYTFQVVNMLSFFQSELGSVSEVEIDLADTTFYRVREVGVYESENIPTSGTGIIDIAEEVLFQEYLFAHCSYYGKVLEKSHLKYQIEYLIAGGNKDSNNLNSVLTKLFAIREVSNFIYLIGDTEKTNVVRVIAAIVAGILLMPGAEAVIQVLLQGIWATYESSLDIKALIKGEKVPLLKSDATWKSDLGDGLFASFTSRETSSTGLTYKEYLHMLLILTNSNEKVYRFMDVIELDIRKTTNNEEFRLDFCMDYIKMQISFSSRVGFGRTWEKKYRYGI